MSGSWNEKLLHPDVTPVFTNEETGRRPTNLVS